MNKKYTFVFGYFCFLIFAGVVPYLNLRFACLPSYDMGIFSETIQHAWALIWDPFLSTREVFWSQDHWDPATLLLGYLSLPLRSFVSAPVLLIWFEISIVYFSGAYLFFSLKKRGFSTDRAWLAFAMILFAKVTWGAFDFLAHPTVWALLPQIYLIVLTYDIFYLRLAVTAKVWLKLFTLAICFWFLGEQMICAWAVYVFVMCCLKREFRKGCILLLLISVGLLCWSFWGRGLLHGAIYNHNARLNFSLMSLIPAYFADIRGLREGVIRLLSFLLPIFLLNSWIQNQIRQGLRTPCIDIKFLFATISFFCPLLVGRFLAMSWAHQYGIVLCGLMSIFLFLEIQKQISKKIGQFFLAVLIISSISDWSKIFFITQTRAPGCASAMLKPTASEWESRAWEIEQAAQIIKKEDRVLSSQFLVPSLLWLRSDLEVHTLGPFRQSEMTTSFDWLWISVGSFANNWPLGEPEIQQILTSLNPSEVHEWKTSILLRGPFVSGLFDKWQGQPIMHRLFLPK